MFPFLPILLLTQMFWPCSCLWMCIDINVVVVVQSLGCVQLFLTPWTAAYQVPLPFTISWSLLMSFESMKLSNHLIFCYSCLFLPSVFLSIRVFSSELALCMRWSKIGASARVLPMNIQGWFPLILTVLISLLSKGLSRVCSSIIFKKDQFFSTLPS